MVLWFALDFSENDIPSNPSSATKTSSSPKTRDGYDYQTIYSDKLVLPTHEYTGNKTNKRDNKDNIEKTRRTTDDVGVNVCRFYFLYRLI